VKLAICPSRVKGNPPSAPGRRLAVAVAVVVVVVVVVVSYYCCCCCWGYPRQIAGG
jgi:hypothetical protein